MCLPCWDPFQAPSQLHCSSRLYLSTYAAPSHLSPHPSQGPLLGLDSLPTHPFIFFPRSLICLISTFILPISQLCQAACFSLCLVFFTQWKPHLPVPLTPSLLVSALSYHQSSPTFFFQWEFLFPKDLLNTLGPLSFYVDPVFPCYFCFQLQTHLSPFSQTFPILSLIDQDCGLWSHTAWVGIPLRSDTWTSLSQFLIYKMRIIIVLT